MQPSDRRESYRLLNQARSTLLSLEAHYREVSGLRASFSQGVVCESLAVAEQAIFHAMAVAQSYLDDHDADRAINSFRG